MKYFWEHYFEYYGYSHCFQDKDEFVKWLQDTGRLYTEDSLRKICKREELDNMKTIYKLNENDLVSVVAERFDIGTGDMCV